MNRQEKKRVRAKDYAKTRREGLRREECEICGTKPAQCHHIDYADPERRMWLCTKCHAQTHSQFGKPAPADWMADIRAAMRRIDAKRASLRAAQSGDSADA
jgi:hypothetical protein